MGTTPLPVVIDGDERRQENKSHDLRPGLHEAEADARRTCIPEQVRVVAVRGPE